MRGFPGSSAGKESAYNAGDPGLIPGSGRSPGEGLGYPLQDSWASLMAHTVKNRLQYGRPGFNPLGWEDSLGEGHVNPCQYSCLENPMDRCAWRGSVHGVAESQT